MADPVYKRISDLDPATLPAATGDLIEVSQSGTSKKAAWGSLFGSGWFANLFAAFAAFKAPDADHADNADTLGSGEDTPADLHDAAQLTGVLDLGRIPTLSLTKIPTELSGKYAAIPRIEVIVSGSGNWEIPIGVTRVEVIAVGGGGGGGGAESTAASHTCFGGGGGGGGVAIRTYDVTPESLCAYSIGSGGLGGDYATDGSNGGNTTFSDGSIGLSGIGGNGGRYRRSTSHGTKNAGGLGGGGSNGSVTIPGTNGSVAHYLGVAAYFDSSGGSSAFGSGGRVNHGSDDDDIVPSGYGAGGGGGTTNGSTASGQNGTGGLLILRY